jgi:hypothetical protein
MRHKNRTTTCSTAARGFVFDKVPGRNAAEQFRRLDLG